MSALGIVAPLAAEARVIGRGGDALRRTGSLVRSGCVGPERAARAARELLADGATALASFGVAGALDARLSPGELVLPERVLGPEGPPFAVDGPWRARLAERLAEAPAAVHGGLLLTSATPLLGGPEKEAAGVRTGALAVDMESAAVAAVAREARVPFLAVRAICEAADTSVPAWMVQGLDGGERPAAATLAALGRHPGDLARLLRLWQGFRRALGSLRLVVRRAGVQLDLEPRPHDPAQALHGARTT